MDIARLMVRTRCASVIEEMYSIQINSNVFRIKIMEEAQGLIRLLARRIIVSNFGSEEEVVGLEEEVVGSVDISY